MPDDSHWEEKVFQSSAIDRAFYNPATHQIRIRRPNGSEYTYNKMAPAWWEGLKSCKSAGQYFAACEAYLERIPQEDKNI